LENFKTIEEAVDHYFSNQHLYAKQKAANVPKVDKASIEAVFDKFASPDDPDALYDDMLQDFVRTCGVDPTKKEALFLFYKLGASNAGELTRTEFVNGWENLGADTNQKMRAFGEKIPKEMEAESEFKEFYKWIFNYLKENKKNRTIRTLYYFFVCLLIFFSAKQLGLAIWSILLNPAQFALLNSFKEFLAVIYLIYLTI
jgi:DCN1-like protein 1/2